jgi:hypothetical protein
VRQVRQVRQRQKLLFRSTFLKLRVFDGDSGDSGDREIEVAVSTVSSEEKCGGDRDDFKQPLTRARFSYCLQCLQCLHPKKAFFGSVFSKLIFGDLPNVPDVPGT